MANGTFRVQLVHSGIGFDRTQKDTLRGLGLLRRHKIVELKDTPAARGMVYKVRHLVKVLEAGEGAKKSNPWKGAIVVPSAAPPKAKKAAKETAAKKSSKASGKKKAAAKKGSKR